MENLWAVWTAGHWELKLGLQVADLTGIYWVDHSVEWKAATEVKKSAATRDNHWVVQKAFAMGMMMVDLTAAQTVCCWGR
jgi:hypothetical protein